MYRYITPYTRRSTNCTYYKIKLEKRSTFDELYLIIPVYCTVCARARELESESPSSTLQVFMNCNSCHPIVKRYLRNHNSTTECFTCTGIIKQKKWSIILLLALKTQVLALTNHCLSLLINHASDLSCAASGIDKCKL